MSYHFFAAISRMKYIDRWQLMRNSREENLCEHSMEVAMIAHALCVIGNVRYGKDLDADRAAVIGLYLLITRRRVIFNRRVLIGALSMIGVTTLFAVANKLTTAANTIVLQFTAPVFVILFMALLYRQKPGRVDLITCFLVLLGVVLFFVDGIRAGNLTGNVAAVLSGICYASVFMMNTGKDADAISSCFLGQLTAGVIMTPLCFGETDFSLPTLAAILALGVVQVGGAYILFSIGIRRTPAVTASLITGMEPIMNPLLVAAFYGERVSPLAVAGAVIVVCSILAYNVWLARKKS